jgi:hypothetical protein
MKATTYPAVILLALLGTGVIPALGHDDPPHTHEVSPGMLACDDGYVKRAGPLGYRCEPSTDDRPGPQVIISEVPSAGDGRPQAGCPPGGCARAIPEMCKAEWPSDFSRQARCVSQQTKALRELEGDSGANDSRPASRRRARRR